MSSSLLWRPSEPILPLGTATVTLKSIISKKYFDHDGSLHHGSMTMTLKEHGEWLRGLVDANVEGAKKLLKDLEDYDDLDLWIE